ncbi:oxygenase MpaB family protein [Daejeonella oryzae]|uniref:oxygenase MpaB family protein n=1 Tax=Daejeonella oryzae TaxID=1122943 RepID=UPI0004285633|nr:oxygenase MpaB family protein [Daejeonella oryzae]
MDFFVKKDSIVRQIWGNADTILLIFAGASAEFALNKAVDWLYFTGSLPSDPLARLFSTVAYAQKIVFSEKEKALSAIDQITAVHQSVEASRNAKIPDWAYRDVLFMLIDYSIRSFELLERKLDDAEKEEVFDVFYRVGKRMGLKGLPENYFDWLVMRVDHIQNNLMKSEFTVDLFTQYHKHLGLIRYQILLETQALVLPGRVSKLLNYRNLSWMQPILYFYKFSRKLKLEYLIKSIILPSAYQSRIKALDLTKDL